MSRASRLSRKIDPRCLGRTIADDGDIERADWPQEKLLVSHPSPTAQLVATKRKIQDGILIHFSGVLQERHSGPHWLRLSGPRPGS